MPFVVTRANHEAEAPRRLAWKPANFRNYTASVKVVTPACPWRMRPLFWSVQSGQARHAV